MKTFTFDIDLTIAETKGNDYLNSVPKPEIVALINRLYDAGNVIKIFTGRGSKSGKDWTGLTKAQLLEWGVKYHELIMGKPDTDYIIDDKNVSIATLRGEDPELIKLFVKAYKEGNKVLICGNGGLAAEASHFAAELVGKFAFEVYMSCFALGDNAALVTAISNDMKFENVFAHQVRVLGHKGDIFIGMTTSQSPNIVGAELVAGYTGLTSIMICGKKSQVKADYIIRMDGEDTAQIQNNAIQFLHALAYAVKRDIWETQNAGSDKPE